MARVPAHTNSPGYYVLKPGVQVRRRKHSSQSTWGAPEPSTAAVIARCYKTVPQFGQPSNIIPGYRESTNFKRIVIRATGASANFKRYSSPGSSAFWAVEQDAYYQCTSLGQGPAGCNAQAGLVNLPYHLTWGSEQDARSAVYNMAADFGEALVELTSTVKSVKGILVDLLRSLLALLKGNWKEVARISRKRFGRKNAPGTYLEWKYAVAPIAQTIEQLLEYTNTIERFTKPRKVERTREASASPQSLYPTVEVNGECTQRSRTTFIVVYENHWANWIASTGLSPLDTLWAVTPYSFIIDWFLPIGQWLQGLRLTNLCKQVDGYRSDVSFATGDVQLHTYSGTGDYSGDRPRTHIRGIGFQRTKIFLDTNRLPVTSRSIVNINQLITLQAMVLQQAMR